MQATGDLVPAAAELAAGVQLGEHELDRADALGRVHVGGDAAPVVLDPDRAVLHERDVDGVGVPGERLVDGVVDDLPHEVVQAALAGRADVHAGPLPHRLEALEDGDGGGVVGRSLALGDRDRDRLGGHGGRLEGLVGGHVGLLVRHGSPSSAVVPPGRPAGHMARAQGRRTPWARMLPSSYRSAPTGHARGGPCGHLSRRLGPPPDPRHATPPLRTPERASSDTVPRRPRPGRRSRHLGEPDGRPGPSRRGRTRPAAAPAGSGRSPVSTHAASGSPRATRPRAAPARRLPAPAAAAGRRHLEKLSSVRPPMPVARVSTVARARGPDRPRRPGRGSGRAPGRARGDAGLEVGADGIRHGDGRRVTRST